MAVRVLYVTDPACSWSWSLEPFVRKLMVEFGEEVSWTYVMGGLARDYTSQDGVYPWLVRHWLDVADESRMPFDPRLWSEGPIGSTYPACMAVKAAAEQAGDGGYLRVLREGLMCFRRKLDTTEALVEEARRTRLDVERFRIDLGSHAIVEAFGSDLETARDVPEEARGEDAVVETSRGERLTFPTMAFIADGEETRWVTGYRPYEDYRAAAEAADARPSGEGPPAIEEALRRFGRMATREIEVVCDLPEPSAAAELWRLASEWKVRPVRVLTGHLWEPA
jgi:protein-disulfide isomerase-like protein with CxxC motif